MDWAYQRIAAMHTMITLMNVAFDIQHIIRMTQLWLIAILLNMHMIYWIADLYRIRYSNAALR